MVGFSKIRGTSGTGIWVCHYNTQVAWVWFDKWVCVCTGVCYLRLDFEIFTLLGTGGSSEFSFIMCGWQYWLCKILVFFSSVTNETLDLGNEGDCIDMFTVAVSIGFVVYNMLNERPLIRQLRVKREKVISGENSRLRAPSKICSN